MTGHAVVDEARTSTAYYRLKQHDSMPMVNADGIADLLAGPSVSQLKLHRIDNIDFENMHEGLAFEDRTAVVTLIMPTLQMIEMAKSIINHFEGNKEALFSNMEENISRAKSLLGGTQND